MHIGKLNFQGDEQHQERASMNVPRIDKVCSMAIVKPNKPFCLLINLYSCFSNQQKIPIQQVLVNLEQCGILQYMNNLSK